MRVLLHGNVNNLPLQVAIGLRAQGVDAHLVVTNAAPLHHPRSVRRRWRWARPKWIHDHSHLTENDFIRQTRALAQSLSALPANPDFALLNAMSPSLDSTLALPQAFINAGSDLTFYGDLRFSEWRSKGWDLDYKAGPAGRAELAEIRDFTIRQRGGIARARFALTGPRGAHPSADRLFDQLGFEDQRRVMWRVAERLKGEPVPPLDGGPMVITSLARVDFYPRPGGTELDLKGTDVLLAGVARAIAQGTDVRLELPLKGADVNAAQQIIHRCGLDSRVSWFPDLPRRAYLDRLASASLVVDSLGPSGPGTVTLDALAAGRPVLGNLAPSVWAPVFGEAYPGFHATDAAGVAAHITKAAHHPNLLREIAIASETFADKHLSIESNSLRLRGLIEAELRS